MSLRYIESTPPTAPPTAPAPATAPLTPPSPVQPDGSAGPSTHEVALGVPTVSMTVSVLPHAPSAATTHLSKPTEAWTWEDLRNYVVDSIETRFGAFPRNTGKEYGVFTRFASTYGPDAGRIARYAFETCEGWWSNAPVSVNRFCRASDEYFAVPILARLNDTSITTGT